VLPVIQLGPLSLPTGPLALLLAVWAALAVGAWAARREGLDGDHIYNAGLYGLVAGFVAARLAHVIVYWDAYRTQLLEIFGFNQRAFLLWPGAIAALAVAGWYVYRHGLPLVKVLDAIAPGALVGIAVADVAALLTGRNAGLPADLPWAVNLWGVSRHPVQIYEALAALAVAALVLWMITHGSRPGAAALVALCGYGLSRWLLEPFRAPEASVTVLGGLRLAQMAGLAVALVALWGVGRLAARSD
jgi:phosphatidylglycerol---prolipoprotein diacylglyceryl transferase